MSTQLKTPIEQLYQLDYVLWLDETLKQLQAKDLENLDWKHLVREIAELASEQRHKVDSYLLQLLIHLLLYQYWQSEREYCQKGWKDEIGNFRVQLEFLFESKTLYNYFLSRLELVYQKAKKRAIQKTELDPNTFPESCPFTIEQILDLDWLPQAVLTK